MHCPYYKQELKNRLNIDIDSFDISKLKSLPILEKKMIREHNDLFHSDEHEKRGSRVNTSGGSTGAPIKVLQDRYYSYESLGTFSYVKKLRTGDPYAYTAVLWGAVRDMYGSDDTLIGKLKSWVNNITMFNSAKQDPDKILSFIDHINTRKPPMILAYAQAIYQVALFAEKNNIDIVPQNVIHTGAGQLFPFMRTKIEEVFQSQVCDHYGGREFGAVATECKYGGGLHILDYNRIV